MIFIDDRIGSKELAPYLSKGIRHQLTRLQSADAAWMGNGPNGPNTAFIGVERKRLRDFLSSIETGRLTGHQLIGMANSYHYLYLVVEGIWREGHSGLIETPRAKGKWEPLDLGSRRFTVSTLDNFSNSIAIFLNVIVVFSPSLARTGAWISNTYRWWTSKQWSQHKACQKKHCVPMPILASGEKQSLVVRVLVEFTGVGPDKAAKIGAAAGSLRGFMAMGVDDLMAVDGVGKVMANRIIEERDGRREETK
jgi:ERCC4-type nuclease